MHSSTMWARTVQSPSRVCCDSSVGPQSRLLQTRAYHFFQIFSQKVIFFSVNFFLIIFFYVEPFPRHIYVVLPSGNGATASKIWLKLRIITDITKGNNCSQEEFLNSNYKLIEIINFKNRHKLLPRKVSCSRSLDIYRTV